MDNLHRVRCTVKIGKTRYEINLKQGQGWYAEVGVYGYAPTVRIRPWRAVENEQEAFCWFKDLMSLYIAAQRQSMGSPKGSLQHLPL